MKTTKLPHFIVIEGIDGSGKDTLARELRDYFASRGIKINLTANPSKSKTGRLIRKMLQGKKPLPKEKHGLCKLFVQGRADGVRNFIKPRLKHGKYIVCVRFVLSSLAYGMLNMPYDDILALDTKIAADGLITPGVTILLDLPPEEGLQRVSGRKNPEFFEKIETLKKVRSNYLFLIQKHPSGVAVIDASQSRTKVFRAAVAAINKYK